MRVLVSMILAALLGSVAVSATPAETAFRKEVLDAHNRERAAVGVAPLVWSDDLAEDAADWAKSIAKKNVFRHDSQRSQGENIWMARAGRMTPASMVASWAAEKKNYLPGRAHPGASRTGNWADVAHYSAIVWSGTTKVGCAISRGATHDFLVCRYSPMGNIAGYTAYDPKKVPVAAKAKTK